MWAHLIQEDSQQLCAVKRFGALPPAVYLDEQTQYLHKGGVTLDCSQFELTPERKDIFKKMDDFYLAHIHLHTFMQRSHNATYGKTENKCDTQCFIMIGAERTSMACCAELYRALCVIKQMGSCSKMLVES